MSGSGWSGVATGLGGFAEGLNQSLMQQQMLKRQQEQFDFQKSEAGANRTHETSLVKLRQRLADASAKEGRRHGFEMQRREHGATSGRQAVDIKAKSAAQDVGIKAKIAAAAKASGRDFAKMKYGHTLRTMTSIADSERALQTYRGQKQVDIDNMPEVDALRRKHASGMMDLETSTFETRKRLEQRLKTEFADRDLGRELKAYRAKGEIDMARALEMKILESVLAPDQVNDALDTWAFQRAGGSFDVNGKPVIPRGEAGMHFMETYPSLLKTLEGANGDEAQSIFQELKALPGITPAELTTKFFKRIQDVGSLPSGDKKQKIDKTTVHAAWAARAARARELAGGTEVTGGETYGARDPYPKGASGATQQKWMEADRGSIGAFISKEAWNEADNQDHAQFKEMEVVPGGVLKASSLMDPDGRLNSNGKEYNKLINKNDKNYGWDKNRRMWVRLPNTTTIARALGIGQERPLGMDPALIDTLKTLIVDMSDPDGVEALFDKVAGVSSDSPYTTANMVWALGERILGHRGGGFSDPRWHIKGANRLNLKRYDNTLVSQEKDRGQ